MFFLGYVFKPCFHETIIILQQHYDIDRFLDGDWLIFCFCCGSLCSVLYNMFITFFSKSIGKRPTVEPSVFWGNRRTLKNNILFSFWCFAFVFVFICSFCCWFVGTHCHPLGQIGHIFGRYWCHFVWQFVFDHFVILMDLLLIRNTLFGPILANNISFIYR